MLIGQINLAKKWQIVSEIILPVLPAPAIKG
jgi:hypothetical protein